MDNIVVFQDGELKLDVNITPEEKTVWLTQDEMALLFDVNRSNITRHITNIFKDDELNETTSVRFLHESKNPKNRPPKYYSLDIIISVGYRVKSKRGITFRKWANDVLTEYLIQGYAVNGRRLAVLNKTIEVQSNIIAGITGIDAAEVLKVINEYSTALELLDDYDHQCIKKPEGTICSYQLLYSECRALIDKMSYGDTSAVFGIEKEPGKVEGILAAVYQEVFGQEVYPTLEEKAGNLLYFLVKDHPFADGCKRIAATIFLEFLRINESLYVDGHKIISDSALVAITLMIAESRPEEKDIMVMLIMNFLKK